MSSTLGHVLAAAVVTAPAAADRPRRTRLALAALSAVAGLAPDVDVIWMALRPGSADVHRGATHTLAFVALVAGALALAARAAARWPAKRLFVLLFAAGASHLVLDALMGAGAPIRPFAPLLDTGFLAPVRLLPVAYYARSAAGFRSAAFLWGNALAAVLELAILAPGWIVLDRRVRPRTRVLAAATALAGLGATILVYN